MNDEVDTVNQNLNDKLKEKYDRVNDPRWKRERNCTADNRYAKAREFWLLK